MLKLRSKQSRMQSWAQIVPFLLLILSSVSPATGQELATAQEESAKTARGIVLASGDEKIPLEIRVGLATDLTELDLACCREGYRLRAEDGREIESVARIAPSRAVRSDVIYRPQVAALKDEQQALRLAETLSRDSGAPCDAIFDAGTDLYKVRCGRSKSREEADALRGRLLGLGVDKAWIATEGQGLEEPGFAVTVGGKEKTVPGRWLELHGPEDIGIPFDDGSYRGILLIFLNERGRLNIINELDLEDYLRGVVPKEMGPALYPQIESLKAQAVAARTYTVRHLGEFAREGYDLCSTPRCQVYGGRGTEHSLSDRAVRETASQVLLVGDALAETFYSATCGGHTENVDVVFPLRSGEHLRGVPCIEAGAESLHGNVDDGAPFPGDLLARLLPPSKGAPAQVLTARVEHLARLAQVPVPDDAIALLGRREVWRYVASLFDLAIDPRLLAANPAILAAPPVDWGATEKRLAAWLTQTKMFQDKAPLQAREIDELLFELSLYLRVLERERIYLHDVDLQRLTARTEAGEDIVYDLPLELATYRFESGLLRDGSTRSGSIRGGSLMVMPGDRLDLYRHQERLLAVVQPNAAPVVRLAPNQARRQSWSESRSDQALRKSVQALYPGFPYEGFEILERGGSGRVRLLRLQGSSGETILVEGLAVRWTLDIPETWFTAQRNRSDNGWIFTGHGWGHGVGMCQTGAFAMAQRGLGYQEILQHYFSGVRLGLVRLRRERSRDVPARD